MYTMAHVTCNCKNLLCPTKSIRKKCFFPDNVDYPLYSVATVTRQFNSTRKELKHLKSN